MHPPKSSRRLSHAIAMQYWWQCQCPDGAAVGAWPYFTVAIRLCASRTCFLHLFGVGVSLGLGLQCAAVAVGVGVNLASMYRLSDSLSKMAFLSISAMLPTVGSGLWLTVLL